MGWLESGALEMQASQFSAMGNSYAIRVSNYPTQLSRIMQRALCTVIMP